MARVNYGRVSPYANTPQDPNFLSYYVHRTIQPDPSDQEIEIETKYDLRPDLMAHDMYGESRLYWVFTARNLNVLEDPIFDFRTGVRIFVPRKDVLNRVLR